MNFNDYYAKYDDEIFEGMFQSVKEASKYEFKDKDKEEKYDQNEDKQNKNVELDESLINFLIRIFKTSIKVIDQGSLIYFKLELLGTKTIFTLRVKRETVISFKQWLEEILNTEAEK